MNHTTQNTHCITPLKKLTPQRITTRKSASFVDPPVQLRKYRQINKAHQLPQSASIIRQVSFLCPQENHSPAHLSANKPISQCITDRETNREKAAVHKPIRYSPLHLILTPKKYIHNASLHNNYEANNNSADLSPSSDRSNSMIV